MCGQLMVRMTGIPLFEWQWWVRMLSLKDMKRDLS
jgi:hypothetical protein